MIFKQVQELLSGRKRQTRRCHKQGEYATDEQGNLVIAPDGTRVSDAPIHTVYTKGGRVKWQVGRSVAVVPKRGMPGLWIAPDGSLFTPQHDPCPKPWHNSGLKSTLEWHGYKPFRKTIEALCYEPVQAITEADAQAEGVEPELMTGSGAHAEYSYVAAYAALWNRINTRPGVRWGDNPDVWCLTFALDMA